MKYLITLLLTICSITVGAEDGSSLWLRNKKNTEKAQVICALKSAIANTACQELEQYWNDRNGTVPVELTIDSAMPDDDGYVIEKKETAVIIKARREAGLLYGAYALLMNSCAAESHPAFATRMLNHWDNLDGSIERGYAGLSLWKWELMGTKTAEERAMWDRVRQYARANASVGINMTVLNNVNASPKMLTTQYLKKVKMIADVLRPYNIKVMLSVNFATPMALGLTATADPLDAKVQQWWKKKAKEIYKMIPDFGGFLVKANSEGQPGPADFNRSHSEGANMLADAVKPYGGLVMWRCFVYGANHKGEDRVKQAVSEFKHLDGEFRDNVILQVKNGPLDFQPREPYAPIFDQIQKTPLMAELQITQEYLGQSRHLVYLAPMWKEFFHYVKPETLVAVAGVANIGDDTNYCGHHFSQANWYAFGRLAWNPELTSDQIAKEWLTLTFKSEDNELWAKKGNDFLEQMARLMLDSREACVNYMMPLGLHHIFKFDHHYGPEPDGFIPTYPLEWCPVYYHQADSAGVGFDRSSTGTNAVEQYREPYCSLYNDIETCPEEYLLWFHHLPWDYQTHNGLTLWEALCQHYNAGVTEVETYPARWEAVKPFVDTQRYNEVKSRIDHQVENAREWRDKCLEYFGSFVK